MPECLQCPAPAEIVRQVFGSHAMEPAQPFFQPAMVGIDVIEMKVGCGWAWLAGPWQDMRDNASTPSKGDDCAPAVTAERIGRCHDAA